MESRTKKAISPDSHSLTVQLLREIEHNQRLWHWANTKEAEKKGTEPEPIMLPGEEEAYEAAVIKAEDEALKVAERLGIKL